MNKIIATDCDGVLLLWEKHFDKWMESQEFTKFAKDHYSIDMNYHLGEGQSKVLIKVFNESAWMRDIEPVEGSVEIVKKLSEQGYKFDVITSQTLDARANELRRENLQTHFGDIMSETHQQITQAVESYVKENEAFETKGIKAAAARARKALGNLGKLAKARRKEIQEKKNSM